MGRITITLREDQEQLLLEMASAEQRPVRDQVARLLDESCTLWWLRTRAIMRRRGGTVDDEPAVA